MASENEPNRRESLLRRAGTLLVTTAVVAGAGALVVAGSGLIAANAVGVETAAEVQPARVRTGAIALQSSYEVPAAALGRVEAGRSLGLGFEAGGTLTEVLVDEGDRVAAGQVLARLDTRMLDAEAAALEAARAAVAARVELAALSEARTKALVEKSQASAARYDEARLTLAEARAELARVEAQIAGVEVALSKAEISAPFDARIAARRADEGAQLAPGTPVLDLLEDRAPIFRAGLAPAEAEGLAPGDVLPVRFGETTVAARLTALRSDIAGTRTLDALFALPADAGLADGALGEVVLTRRVSGEGAWVPLSALTEGVRGLWTLYLVEDGAVRREAVEILHADQSRAYVTGALADGAAFVADGPHRVAVGQAVAALTAAE